MSTPSHAIGLLDKCNDYVHVIIFAFKTSQDDGLRGILRPIKSPSPSTKMDQELISMKAAKCLGSTFTKPIRAHQSRLLYLNHLNYGCCSCCVKLEFPSCSSDDERKATIDRLRWLENFAKHKADFHPEKLAELAVMRIKSCAWRQGQISGLLECAEGSVEDCLHEFTSSTANMTSKHTCMHAWCMYVCMYLGLSRYVCRYVRTYVCK